MERLAVEHAAASQGVVAAGPDTPRVSAPAQAGSPSPKPAKADEGPGRDLIAELPGMDDADVLALANRPLRGASADVRAMTKAARAEAKRRDPAYTFTKARALMRGIQEVDATGGEYDRELRESPATPDIGHLGKGR